MVFDLRSDFSSSFIMLLPRDDPFGPPLSFVLF